METASSSTETTSTSTQETAPAPTDPAKPDASKPTTTPTNPPAQGAPEAYTAFTAPEGYTLDPKAIEAATPIFRELGLTQAQAQRLVSLNAEQMIAAAKAPQATYEATRADWQAKTLAHPDIRNAVSGDKTGIEAVKADIGRALNSLGDTTLATEFKSAMDLTGAGDNPAFVRVFHKLAQFVVEGRHVTGAGPSPAGQRAPGTSDRPSAAKSLYPNNP